MNWQHALDIQMDQVKWLRTEYGQHLTESFFYSYFGKVGFESDEIDDRQMWHNLQETMWRADTLFVTQDMQHILLQAAHDLPEDACFDIRTLICPMGFVLFEETIYGQDVSDHTIAVSGLAWHAARGPDSAPENEQGEMIAIYFLTPTDDPLDYVNEEVIPKYREAGVPIPPLALSHFYPALDGATIPKDDHPGATICLNLLKMFLAMQLLAQQKIGEPMQMRPPRATRRRWKFAEGQRMITLITLRRKSVKKDDHEPQKVEWSRRWVVKGHWRRQFYPKSNRHDYVYIYEHIKGPEDKPLVITERRVFNFRR